VVGAMCVECDWSL